MRMNGLINSFQIYISNKKTNLVQIFLLFAIPILLSGCASPKVLQADTNASVTIDGKTLQVSIPAGSTVQNAIDVLAIELGPLDRVEPPLYTVLTEEITIKIIRVREEFITEQQIIPFTHQELRSETISLEETRLIQPGENGLQEITYRVVYENENKTATTIVKDLVIQPAVPEIVMIGVQSPFSPLSIPGKLVYLSVGNAWIMEGSTAIRRPLVTTGDLDGRIFSLSPDGNWLLFTRKSFRPAGQELNTLWVVSTEIDKSVPIDLKISNVALFAAWVPGQANMVSYSTVEPREGSPRWQANNDLYFFAFSPSGWTSKPRLVVEPNSGGTYGWWGSNYAWSPDGNYLAYVRPDEIGFVNLENGDLEPLIKIIPLQTRQDWAWIPGITWGSDSNSLYFSSHAPSENLTSSEESPIFNLTFLSISNKIDIKLEDQTGMFSYPASSPNFAETTEIDFNIGFLQAIFPDQSETSRYRFVIMDRDGSNRQTIFPSEDLSGIEPQTPVWAPFSPSVNAKYVSLLFQGNIWLIDTLSKLSQQITGDGLIERVDWK